MELDRTLVRIAGREVSVSIRDEYAQWYERQQHALARGEEFDEPPPWMNGAMTCTRAA